MVRKVLSTARLALRSLFPSSSDGDEKKYRVTVEYRDEGEKRFFEANLAEARSTKSKKGGSFKLWYFKLDRNPFDEHQIMVLKVASNNLRRENGVILSDEVFCNKINGRKINLVSMKIEEGEEKNSEPSCCAA